MPEIREREEFLALLRGRGQRITGERLELFDEVFAQHGHIDAEELLRSMRARGSKISRATVYRNLGIDPHAVEIGMRVRAEIVDLPGGDYRVAVFHPV